MDLNGHSIPYHVQENDQDQHASFRVHVIDRPAVIEIRLKNDFGISEEQTLPALGSMSTGLRIVRQQWNESRDALALETASSAGGSYELGLWNAGQVASVDGAELVRGEAHDARLRIHTTANSPDGEARQKVTIHFTGGPRMRKPGDPTESPSKGAQIDH